MSASHSPAPQASPGSALLLLDEAGVVHLRAPALLQPRVAGVLTREGYDLSLTLDEYQWERHSRAVWAEATLRGSLDGEGLAEALCLLRSQGVEARGAQALFNGYPLVKWCAVAPPGCGDLSLHAADFGEDQGTWFLGPTPALEALGACLPPRAEVQYFRGEERTRELAGLTSIGIFNSSGLLARAYRGFHLLGGWIHSESFIPLDVPARRAPLFREAVAPHPGPTPQAW